MEEIKCNIADSVLNDIYRSEDVGKMRDEYKHLEFTIGVLREENNDHKIKIINILEKSVN